MKLVYALLAKSLAETVLVAALGLTFYFSTFPPFFHGWGELAGKNISGWVVDHSAPWSRVEVQLFIDDRFVSATSASQSRPDVVNSGWARDEWHGYTFPTPVLRPGWHEARVYALHSSRGGARQSLQLVGDPVTFLVDENGGMNRTAEAPR
jgi:hypothetical protein